MKFIVKLAPEITIKSRPVRKRFVARLHTNIRRVLKRNTVSADVVLRWDMLEVAIDNSSECYLDHCSLARDLLRKIPGIAHILQVQERAIGANDDGVDSNQDNGKYGDNDKKNDKEAILEIIYRETASLLADDLEGKTFVVRCKRQGKHAFSSHDVERYVGGGLFTNGATAGVKMRGADVTVNLEIKQDRLFIVEHRYAGLGGYPIGCVGPVLSLMSGGYDSSVASFDTIRRGMETHFCFFNLGGHAHEVGVKQVSHFLWEEYASSHRTAFVNVNFERVVEEILTTVNNSYMGVILKRMMIRAASRIAQEMDIEILVTGESIAQVSSQTLRNLSVIDKVTDMLVLRPLATEDKSTIISRSNKIGVGKYAEHMPEYCAVISDKPTTSAKMDIVLHEESKFDFLVLDAAVKERKITGIDNVYQPQIAFEEIEQQAIPEPNQIIIDLRPDDERDKKPLVLHANETLNIPFYQINRLFHSLDSNKQYLLFCDRGVMSRLHAAHLQADGFGNVKVYRPE